MYTRRADHDRVTTKAMALFALTDPPHTVKNLLKLACGITVPLCKCKFTMMRVVPPTDASVQQELAAFEAYLAKHKAAADDDDFEGLPDGLRQLIESGMGKMMGGSLKSEPQKIRDALKNLKRWVRLGHNIIQEPLTDDNIVTNDSGWSALMSYTEVRDELFDKLGTHPEPDIRILEADELEYFLGICDEVSGYNAMQATKAGTKQFEALMSTAFSAAPDLSHIPAAEQLTPDEESDGA